VKQRFLSAAAIGCAALVFILSACREDAIIKSSLTPSVDNIHTFGIGPDFNNGSDTITVQTSTGFQDSITTSSRNTGFPIFHALGFVVDPFAGKTFAGIYTQFAPTAVNTTLSTTPDSVVLVLPYSGFTWGDTTQDQTHTFKVFAISSSFSKDTTYYNYSRLATNTQVIGTGSVLTGHSATGQSGSGYLQDSVKLGKSGLSYTPHLRIKLDSNWVKNSLLPAVPYDSSFTAFIAQFPGLFIAETDTIGGMPKSLPYFRLNGTSDLYGSAALLVYSNGSDTAVQFPYNETYCAHFNRITRNYAGYPIANLMSTGTSAETVVMQNGPGAVVDLVLPNIKGLAQKLPAGAIINKAEITFIQVPSGQTGDEKYFPPIRLYPQGVNATGGIYTIADRYPINDASLNFMDGTSATITRGSLSLTAFRLNIPRELQQAIVAGVGSLHLRIGGTVNFPAAYRVALGGRGNANAVYRPALNIIYSKQ
jgi:hypothetical protein